MTNDELRARGINPEHYSPRLSGAFGGYQFTGNFEEDLEALNAIYEAEKSSVRSQADDVRGEQDGALDTVKHDEDYRSALDKLFTEYPEVETFKENADGKNLYINTGIDYFRQGDLTRTLDGYDVGTYSAYHVNNDDDTLATLLDSPAADFLSLVGGGGLAGLADAAAGQGGLLDSVIDVGMSGFGSGMEGNEPIPPDPVDEGGPGGLWDLIETDLE